MKILTLALPVYNGEDCIELTLESIFEAQGFLNEDELLSLEIIVSDNQSTDNTASIVEKYDDTSLSIRYNCNSKNLGYDGNIDMLVSLANGKYVWFLGCGEKINKDALKRLFQKLNNTIEYTNILVDFDIYDESKNKITDKNIFHFNEDITILEKNNFSKIKYGPAVSSNIINKRMWEKVQHVSLVVDGWIHIERILSMIALSENSKTLFLTKAYFTLYREKDGWWTKPNSYLLLLLLLHIKVIRSMRDKGYDAKVVKSLELKQSRIALLMAIVQSKEFGMKLNKKILIEMIDLFKYDYFFWAFSFPLLLLPRKLTFLPRGIFKILQSLKSFIK